VVDIKSLTKILQKASWRYLILAYTVNLLGIFLCSGRWMLLLRSKNIITKYFFLLRLYLIGILYNNFFPGTIGGDAYKAHRVFREHNTPKKSFIDFASCIFLDRFFGLMTAVTIATIIIIFRDKEIYHPNFLLSSHLIITMYYFGLTIFLMLLFSKKFEMFIKMLPASWINSRMLLDHFFKSINIFSIFELHKKKLLTIITISFIFYFISFVGTPFFLLYSLHRPIDYLTLLCILPFLNLIVMLPISIGGIGVRETTYVYFLSFLNISPEVSLSVGLLISGITIVNGLIGGILDFFTSKT
jgi:uncharacterized protein (TIRG00374 family)